MFEEDDEAADIWLNEMKVDPNRFGRIGAKDNFWSMGDTGPCGPCTEIFYDHGEHIPGGPPGSPDEDGDRYIEIWNLVFMQYDRQPDGKLKPLPKPSVDTGMGLERLAAILQGVHSNYEIDLFENLIKAAAKATNTKDLRNKSLNVIADHIRSCAFLIVDGVTPSNEGRGYVLRRIIRRAARHGHQLGQNDPFFYTLVDTLCEQMGEAYPELLEKKEQVQNVLKKEEQRFGETLSKGMKILGEYIRDFNGVEIDGQFAFTLYDTYGFPVDLTADVAREYNLGLDQAGFDKAMDEQRGRGKEGSGFGKDYTDRIELDANVTFTGYDTTEDKSKIIGLFKEGKEVKTLKGGESGIVILKKTPFL